MATARFASTRDITEELKSLVDATKNLERGAFISHAQIEELTGINRDNKVHKRLISSWKRSMTQFGLQIKAAIPAGTGYRILTLYEQTVTEPGILRKQGMRRFERAAVCIGCVPREHLSEDEARMQHASLGLLAELKEVHQVQQATIASWLSNPKTLPKLPAKRI